MCGATIIDDYWVLTAAHCARGILDKAVVVLRKPTSNREIIITVKQAFVHPEYNNITAENDIAILKVSLTYKGIIPICLQKNDDILLKKDEGIVVGFGLSIRNATSSISILESTQALQITNVPLISHINCRKTWQAISFGTVKISDRQICAGSFMHGTAPGDSGGPLIVQNGFGDYIQIGVTSFGADGLSGLIDQGAYPGGYS
ncbi:unnamed protein product [Caenorhabditis bovis]|uniref:Peptidase S1 domain-containing protein n=1 Tax=Caenorhabditis bovis TaxID=2654633 RepID=A0A8S1F5B2_9PELO|nr:unnamed protein product [Caenorhabditis bovis]